MVLVLQLKVSYAPEVSEESFYISPAQEPSQGISQRPAV